MEAMPPILQSQVLGQLAVRNPDHVPDDPYTIEELYEAATLKLYGTSSANITPYVSHTSIIDGRYPIAQAVPNTMPTMQQATVVKKEEVEDVKLQDILIAMGHMTQTVTNALMTLQAPAQGSYQQGGQQRNQYQGNQYNNQNRAPANPTMQTCWFCNNVGHIIKSCPEAERLIGENKCKRNEYGVVVMPNGSYVPNLTGGCMRDNIEEYYRRNGPKSQMMITIEEPVRAQAAIYTLSRDERIATLRDELMQLEDPATYAYTRVQKARGDQPRPYEPPRRVPRPAPARNDESREVEPNAATSRPQ